MGPVRESNPGPLAPKEIRDAALFCRDVYCGVTSMAFFMIICYTTYPN